MTRNPMVRKCSTCGELTSHWKIHLKTKNIEGYACYECDTLRDLTECKDLDVTEVMEAPPIEAAIQKSPKDCELREMGRMTE